MTLNEAQKRVDQWIKTYGVRYFNEMTNMAILTEEVGELARIMARKYGEQSFKEGENQDPAEEMADVLWVLICLANQTGVNLTDALERSFEKKTQRDNIRHKNNIKLKKNPIPLKSDNYFNFVSSSSMEQVNLHFGKPLQPTKSPYLPERLSKSLPQSGHEPTTLGS